MNDRLRRKISAFSVQAGDPTQAAPDEPRHVVLVPPRIAFARGFAIARRLLREGHVVRLVGDGVTFDTNWPDWVKGHDRFVLTELGAYCAQDIVTATNKVRADIETWTDGIFAGLTPGLRPSDVYYSGAGLRLWTRMVEAYPLVLGLVESSPGGTIHCVDERWWGLEQLRHLGRARGCVGLPEARPQRLWPAGVAALGAAGFAAAIAEQIRLFALSSRSRAKLGALRRSPAAHGVPTLWCVMFPDWLRANRHVIESVIEPALSRGTPIGILLAGSLLPGARSETFMRSNVGRELWPGLGSMRSSLGRHSVDQLFGPESLGGLSSVVGRVAQRTCKLTWRLATKPAVVRHGAFRFDLASHPLELGKLVTQDVMKTTAAEYATRAFLKRTSVEGATVVFPGSKLAPETVADLLLQRAGSRTVEFVHGTATNYWVGSVESRSTVRCVWCIPDAKGVAQLGQQTIVAGMPRLIRRKAPRASPARNILLISNYLHRDDKLGEVFAFEAFLYEFLATVDVIRASFGERFRFLWRPPPADNDRAIQRFLGRLSGVELSRGRALADDVAWSDVVISSLSSAAVEALFAGVPIFIQPMPMFAEWPVTEAFDR